MGGFSRPYLFVTSADTRFKCRLREQNLCGISAHILWQLARFAALPTLTCA